MIGFTGHNVIRRGRHSGDLKDFSCERFVGLLIRALQSRSEVVREAIRLMIQLELKELPVR